MPSFPDPWPAVEAYFQSANEELRARLTEIEAARYRMGLPRITKAPPVPLKDPFQLSNILNGSRGQGVGGGGSGSGANPFTGSGSSGTGGTSDGGGG